MRDKAYTIYWYLRLAGHRVDPAKNIIYRHKNWRFVLEGEQMSYGYNKHRIIIGLNPLSRRVERVRIE